MAGIGLLLVIWTGLAALYPPLLVPSPLDVLRALVRLSSAGTLWQALGLTAIRLLVAFGLSAVLGVTLGVLAGRSRAVAGLLQPLIGVTAGVPPISWIALALIWFGTGSVTPILVALLVSMPVILTATREGVRAFDPDLLAMAQAFGLRGVGLLREFYLPALAPHLLSGLSSGAALTVRVGIMGEFLASNAGIGSAMALARTRLDTAEVLAWVVVALGLLFCTEGLILRPLSRRSAAWRQEA